MDTSKLNHDTTPILIQVQKSTTVEDFRKFIEVEVLNIIQDLAEKGTADQEKIQAIARLTLELIKPGMTLEQLYLNAVKLDDQYSELAPVVYKVMHEYEEKYQQKALNQVSEYIKKGSYDEAQELVKKVLKFKMTE